VPIPKERFLSVYREGLCQTLNLFLQLRKAEPAAVDTLFTQRKGADCSAPPPQDITQLEIERQLPWMTPVVRTDGLKPTKAEPRVAMHEDGLRPMQSDTSATPGASHDHCPFFARRFGNRHAFNPYTRASSIFLPHRRNRQ
jgi:hypothetical protein